MGTKDRSIVIEKHLDADYQRILDNQNSGQHCPHCDARHGHFIQCPLISRHSTVEVLAASV
jgi:hypothetical protein